MAHLAINPNASFQVLVKLVKKYSKEHREATDLFEKAEIASYLETISQFCIFRGGWNYKFRVFDAAKY